MKKSVILLLSVTALVTSCKDGAKQVNNPLMQKFETPFQTPPFDKIKPADYKPAFEEGMKQHKAEIEAIVNNPEEPTFENTIVALDRAGELLNQTSSIFFNLYEAMKNDEMQQLALEISPAVTAHGDEINMNPKLFARIKALYDKRRLWVGCSGLAYVGIVLQ